MILAGLSLGAAVLVSWPEPTIRVVRLPDGESQPKTPRVELAAATRPAREPAAVPQAATEQPRTPAAIVQPEEPSRVLAAIEPAPELSDGPAPVPSDFELSGSYRQESPEELGAKPLPGVEVTPTPPPAAG